MLYYIYDLILLGIVVLCVIVGHKNGFLATFLGTMSWFAAFLVSSLLNGPVATWCYNAFAKNACETFVEKKIPDELVTGFSQEKLNTLLKQLGDKFHIAVIPEGTVTASANMTKGDLAARITETYLQPFVMNLLQIGAAVLLFIVVLILLKLLVNATKITNHLPVVGGVNRFLGGVFGLAKGVVFVWLFCLLLAVAITLSNGRFPWLTQSAIDQTLFTHKIMELLS